MKCDKTETYIIDYIDQNLDKSILEEIEMHLATCEKCNDEVKKYKELLHSISEIPQEKPGEIVRKDFHKMLQSEIDVSNTYDDNPGRTNFTVNWSSTIVKIAACIALLITGAFIGILIQQGVQTDKRAGQIDNLQLEIKTMKELLMYTMLNEESPSQRIKAVNYAEGIPDPDSKVIHVLIHTLNNDKNVNVRLAAAYSLEKYSADKTVRDSLVISLGKQTDPIIQVVLMNILVENKEIKAVKPMREIISNKNTLKEVKDIAQKSINVLL